MRPKKISNENILSVVRQCLLEHGVSVSTQVIADRIGVSQATLFKRFSTKEALFLAAMSNHQPEKLLGLFRQPPNQQPMRQQLLAMSIQMLAFFNDVMPTFWILHSAGLEMPPMTHESPPVKARIALTNWLKRAQEQGQVRSTIDAEAVAVGLIGAIQTRTLRTRIMNDTLDNSDEEYLRAIVSVFCDGLEPATESS